MYDFNFAREGEGQRKKKIFILVIGLLLGLFLLRPAYLEFKELKLLVARPDSQEKLKELEELNKKIDLRQDQLARLAHHKGREVDLLIQLVYLDPGLEYISLDDKELRLGGTALDQARVLGIRQELLGLGLKNVEIIDISLLDRTYNYQIECDLK